MLELRTSNGLDAPYRCYFRVESADPTLVQRYHAEGIDDVVIWADQLWPAEGDVDSKRATLAQTAGALGL